MALMIFKTCYDLDIIYDVLINIIYQFRLVFSFLIICW